MQHRIIEATEQWDANVVSIDPQTELSKDSYRKEVKRPGDTTASECFSLKKGETGWHMSTSYFIGVDWLDLQKSALRVSPKFNSFDDPIEIDYLKMLESALCEPKNFQHLDGLLWVDFSQPAITIPRQDDNLSLFLISEYIQVMAHITSKGLKKAYYFEEENQRSKLKGKLLLAQNIKRNNLKGNYADNYCRFQNYGVDIPENRLLKKALTVASHILDGYKEETVKQLKTTVSSIRPRWQHVSGECDERKISSGKVNPFYKEYPVAINLAKLILRKMSFNQVMHGVSMTTTPPYWIDMSKLFEMYVFALLRNRFSDNVIYHPHFRGQEPDYLLLPKEERPPYIIDAKYKRYAERPIETDDIRQVSGYGRMKSVRKALNVTDHSLIPCLIIYPEHGSNDFIPPSDKWIDEGRYLDVYKLGVTLPII
jgi:5-methylcytosine-specific restriction enzyme subunit McrC